jgi:2'-5' RNA ligase
MVTKAKGGTGVRRPEGSGLKHPKGARKPEGSGLKRAKGTGKPEGSALQRPTIRAFVALDLDTLSLRRVARLSDRLRMASGAPSATWAPTGNLHVTLQFLGDVPESSVAAIAAAIAPFAEGKPAPAASALRLTAFPSTEEARVVVVELVDASGEVAALAQSVAETTAKYQSAKKELAFRPHVTVAGLRLAYDARKWMRAELADIAGDCRAASMTLYESQPGAEAPTYVPRARFAFSS